MQTHDHDRIEELLAGYVLQSLTGADAARADELLTEHVPTCPMCRDTLADFQAVTGDLALSAHATAPPDTLLARLRREAVSQPSRAPARRWNFPVVAAAASFVALIAVAGFAFSLNDRLSRTESQRELISRALSDASTAGVQPQALQGQEGDRPDNAMVEVSGPQIRRFTLYGNDVPDPAPGNVYRMWFGKGGQWDYKGQFVPEGGYVGLTLVVDTTEYDQVLITEEPAGSHPSTPSSDWAWSTNLTG